MRVITPKSIYDAFDKCKKYVKPGPILDSDAPEEAKEAFEIWIKWEKEHEDFM